MIIAGKSPDGKKLLLTIKDYEDTTGKKVLSHM